MSNVNKMSMKSILDRVNIILTGVDQIFYFYEDKDRKEKIDILKQQMKKNANAIYEFLIENDDKINKEKFFLLVTKNHVDRIKFFDSKIKEVETKLSNKLVNEEEKGKLRKSLSDFLKEKKEKEDNLKQLRKLGNNLDVIFTVYYFDEGKQQYDIDVFDSEIIIKGKRRNSSKQIEKFRKVDEELKKIIGKDYNGINYILQILLLTDFNEIFEDRTFGNTVRADIIDNELINNKIRTRDEIEAMRSDEVEYDATAELLDFDQLVVDIREKTEQYIDYLDFDKLLMISACKIEDVLETGLVEEKYFKGEKLILQCILNNLEKNNKKYTLNLQFNSNRDGKYIQKELTYSRKNIEECIKRFTENSYLTKKYIEEKRDDIQEGMFNISDLTEEEINIIFSDEELNSIENLSDNDLAYLSERFNWDTQTILEKLAKNKNGCSKEILEYFINLQKIEYKDVVNLYLNQTIDMDKFKETCKKTDVSKLINPYELIDCYNASLENSDNKQIKEKYNRYINLCNEYILTDEEKANQFSEDLMESLVEGYDEKNKGEYINKIEEFFGKKLISLDTLLEWNKEDQFIIKQIITDMYNNGVVKLETVKDLIKSKVLGFEYLEELVTTEGMNHDKIMKILNQGVIDEKIIFELFAKKRISGEDLISLGNKDIVDSEEVNQILGIKRDNTITDDQYILLISGALQKIKTTGGGKSRGVETKYNKKVIDPDKRLELFELLGARKYEAILPKNSPFYNYDFFVIPGKEGDYKNGIIIAERIYEEKPKYLGEDEEVKYAADNATYIFENIEDIKVIERSEKQNKTDAIKKKKGIIKRVNHVLADGRKNGRWAFDLRDAIIKIMIESDLKEYSKANQSTIINQKLREVYGVDRWMKITNKAAEIDCSSDHKMVDDDDDAR